MVTKLLKILKILRGLVEDTEGLPEDLTSNDLVYFMYMLQCRL